MKMGSRLFDESICFYSLHGLTFKVRWEGKGIKEEIEKLFSPYPFTKLVSTNNSFHFDLQFTTSETPANIPYTKHESPSYYDVSIIETGKSVYLTDGLSMFQVQPHAGVGSATLHHSLKKKSPLSKHNFLQIGILYILSYRRIFLLHAAGLVREGAGYLLLGDSRSGKSSITLSLVRQGWQYISDDALLLKSSEGRAEVSTFRKEFYLDTVLVHNYPEIDPYLGRSTNGDSNKRFLDVDLVYPDRFCPSGFPKVLIFTCIVPQFESKLVPLDQTAALIELTKQSSSIFFNRRTAQVHFEMLKQLVYQTDSYQLLAGRDLYKEPEKISDVLSGIVPENKILPAKKLGRVKRINSKGKFLRWSSSSP